MTRRISVCIDGFIVHGHSRGCEVDLNTTDNAYVSGLKEDLVFHGNELVRLQTMYTIGAVLGQLSRAYLFTKLPMSWVYSVHGCCMRYLQAGTVSGYFIC